MSWKIRRIRHGALLGVVTAVLSTLAAAPAVAAPQASRSRVVVSIPDAAMLQADDLGVDTVPAAEDLRPWVRPPEPCGWFRSSGKRTAQRAVQALYPVSEIRPTVLLSYVAAYRGGGARQYLSELFGAVRRCGGCVDDGRTWRVVDRGVAGRESLLLSVSETVGVGDDGSRVQTIYVAVARVGHAVVVVADLGWETGDGHEAIIRELAPVAARRATILR